MQCEYYFAYGSNMNPSRMAVRGMQYRDSMAARLEGWALAFNTHKSGRDIVGSDYQVWLFMP